ncbi:Uncharacterised protein [Bacteroides xylanisolvens]|nr:Uncharacterised protein [Bacteroides xylanisolvens]
MMQIALRFQQLLYVLIDLTYRKSLLIHTSSPSKAPLTSQGMKETLHPSAHTFPKETLIQSLSDFTLELLCIARNKLTRIASYLKKAMTKLCIKILVNADSAIESAFP